MTQWKDNICCFLHVQNEGTLCRWEPSSLIKWFNLYLKHPILKSTIVPFIQKRCRPCCGILSQAWFDTDWIWVYCQWMVRLWTCILCILFSFWTFPAASWTQWLLCAPCPDCVLVYAWTLPLFFSLVCRSNERPPPPHQHMFLHWTSIAETCTTWQ